MHVTSLSFRTDLALLQLGGSQIEDQGDHLVIRSPANPLHWWGNFLLLAAVPTAATSPFWLDRFADAFPDARHIAIGVDGTDRSQADAAWFIEQRFEVEASAVMTAQSVDPPERSPSLTEYRALTSDADWAQSVDLTTRCDFGDEPDFLLARARTNRELTEQGHGRWLGAFLDGRLVAQLGLLLAGDGLARYQNVETDPAYRRRGLAGTLVHHAARFGLDEMGAHTLVMVADPDYFAIDLYRAVGFRVCETDLRISRRPEESAP